MHTLSRAVQKYVGKTPLVLDEALDPGLPYVECDSDERLGPDRAAADIAAIAKYGAPLVVLDFGTATTLDAVSREGVYLGGCITAGVQVSIDGLFQKTALLPRVELVKPDTVLSTTAVGQIQACLLYTSPAQGSRAPGREAERFPPDVPERTAPAPGKRPDIRRFRRRWRFGSAGSGPETPLFYCGRRQTSA